MKKLVVVFAMAACLVGAAGQASAATTGNISVTVSLMSVTSVLVTPGSWPIGATTFGATDLLSFSAENDGTEAINLTITGANGAGGWTIGGSSGADQFSVDQQRNSRPFGWNVLFDNWSVDAKRIQYCYRECADLRS